MFKGEEELTNDGTDYDLLMRLKEICREKKVKLLIMCKTVLYKRTADVNLLREINGLEDYYSWSIKHGCLRWVSLEV